MTKVIILGEAQGAEPEKKKIEFWEFLRSTGRIDKIFRTPCEFEFIELVSLKYNEGEGEDFDLMFAHNGNRSEGVLVIGKFNDGVV